MTFQKYIRRFSGRPFIRRGATETSFETFAQQTAVCRKQIEGLVKKGDRVILGNMPPEACTSWLFAIWSVGATAFPVSHRLPPAAIQSLISETRPVLLIGFPDRTAPVPVIDPGIYMQVSSAGAIDFSLLSEEPALFIMTSGSTGSPKYAALSLSNLYYSALGVNEYFRLQPGQHWLLDLPLFHVGGLAILIRCFISGATVALKEETLQQEIIRRPPDFISLVSAQYNQLKDSSDCLRALTGTRLFLGGSAISPTLISHIRSKAIRLYTSYGMTEMASTVAIRNEQDGRVSVLNYRQLKIEKDELLLKGRCLFLGYWRAGAIHPATDTAGWFHSGDLGKMTQQGPTVTGRIDNMFISGGENIQPEEIETVLRNLPGIMDALVFPIPDSRFGQRPACFIQFSGNKGMNRDTLCRTLEKRLPRFKIPVHFFKWPSTRVNTSLKILRSKLAALRTNAEEIH